MAARPQAPLAMTITTSSSTGTLATNAAGPFTPSVTVQLAPGTFSSVQVYYQDTTSGTATLTASAPGTVAGTLALTVSGAAAVSLQIEPVSATLTLGATASFSAVGIDGFGNPIPSLSAAWTLAPGTPGALAPTSGASTTYTASGQIGKGQVIATVTTPTGPLSATAPIVVTPPPVVRVAAIRYGVRHKTLNVYVTVVDARGRRVPNAGVTVFLYRNGKLYGRAGARAVAGRTTFTRPASWGTYRAVVRKVTATGLRWNGKTPPNRFVRAQRK